MLYKLSSITHSGRKGARDTPVDNYKYDGLVGSTVEFDVKKIKQYQSLYFDIIQSDSHYEWWETSAVLEVWIGKDTGHVRVETANSIYSFDRVEES